jgi:ribosome biogenesis GTPase
MYCQFSDCTHTHEPGCAVLEAVEQGEVHPERYESYLRLREGEE